MYLPLTLYLLSPISFTSNEETLSALEHMDMLSIQLLEAVYIFPLCKCILCCDFGKAASEAEVLHDFIIPSLICGQPPRASSMTA